jgi:EAL domain-containing protein (putative c-di-GMP-specific phosphodiesterase class I)/GGDEF domain-containing protein
MMARSTPQRMRARVGGARRHAATARIVSSPTTLKDAVEQLAGGDLAVRLPAAGRRVKGAAAFNAVADRLVAALASSDPAGTSLLDGISSAYAEAGHLKLFVAIVGLGRFGELRRQLGSNIAADILQVLCNRLAAHVPELRLGRVGRTQIEILFAAPSAADAEQLLERARIELEAQVEIEDQVIDVEVAIGYAQVHHNDDIAIENAAIALARAQSGHAKIAVFSAEERRAAAERVQLMRDLHRSLAEEELYLHYQPKFRPRTGEIDSAEALIRWKHPEHGMVPPDHFIGLAEETGAIADVTRWVVQKAVADQKLMTAAGHAVPIYVNLSGRLVADADFTRWLLTQIAELPAGDLGLEITETAIISDPEHALANLQILADAGAPIAIDDYGAGLSSLAYLKQLPATELKIDRLFVMGLTSSHRDPLLVRSTIDLAHALEMEVTAEGVENGATLALLRTMGCDLIQGFFIARPMPLEDFQQLLRQGVEVETDFSFMQTFRRRAE